MSDLFQRAVEAAMWARLSRDWYRLAQENADMPGRQLEQWAQRAKEEAKAAKEAATAAGVDLSDAAHAANVALGRSKARR
jgi:hypothetical protein